MQEDFKEYLKEARQRFCNETQKYSVKDNLRLRTEVDSFLIAYDQAVSKAFSLNAVSQQREMFINLVKYIENYHHSTNILDHGKFIDEYISKIN